MNKDDKGLELLERLNGQIDELHTEIQAVYDEIEGLRRDFNTIEMMTAKNAFSKNPFGFPKGVFLCVTFFGKR